MNSCENEALSHEIDQTLEIDRLKSVNADLLEALEACRFAINLGLNAELKPYAKAWNGLLHSVDTAISKAKGD